MFTILLCGGLLIITMKEQNNRDKRDAGIILVVGAVFAGMGWKLSSYLRKYETETGQSSKPFGWMPQKTAE